MNSLTIKNLSFSFSEDKKILNNVSFEIKEGSYVSLLGHNGSGKSTLAKIMVGLLQQSEGQVFINDVELTDKTLSSLRNKVSIVFQNPDNQFIGATVEDDIAFSLENRNIPRNDMKVLVHQYAEKVGMLEYLHKEPSYLSGGQKQRVAIADALVIAPDILILDEACSMLDPKGKNDVKELIYNMRLENPKLTVISITHDIEEAAFSDEIILLDKGQVVSISTPEELFTKEDLISQYGLSAPFIYKLKNALKEEGIKSGLSLEEMEDALCR